MPELAEVETLRRQLLPVVVGQRVQDVVSDGNPRFTDAEQVRGACVQGLGRRGKYLIFDVGEREMVVHLGMTGVVSVHPRGEGPARLRARWEFEDSSSAVTLGDVRGFGRVVVVPHGDHSRISGLARLGPEPLEDFDTEAFARALTRKGAPVKARLLDQGLMAGVGNYVADEGLWRARVHPAKRAVSLVAGKRLAHSLVEVLEEAILHGGMSMRDYVHTDGSTGTMAGALSCYGRAGLPCLRCGKVLVKSVVAGRGSTWCPRCQRP